MRITWLIVLALLAGCAARPHVDDQPAIATYGGDGLKYETVRPASPEAGNLRADLTLLELDAAWAEQLLGIENTSDIAPRSYVKPMGEIAAVNACYGHGRLIARPSLALKPNEEASWSWSIEHVYLQDWSNVRESASPVFATITDGVEVKLTWTPVNSGDSIKLESVSSQVATPIQDFTTSIGVGTPIKIQIPEIMIAERVGVETLRAGETAMFQLSRAGFEDSTRIRLLFVRLVAAE